MTKNPWHRRYHSDALTGYRKLSLELRGAYTTILDLLYDSGEDALFESDRAMAGQLDVSPRKWRSLRDELVALGKLILLPDGRITNARYLRERAKDAAISAKRAEAGSKGGRAAQAQREMDLTADDPATDGAAKAGEFGPLSAPENTHENTHENVTNQKDKFDERAENVNEINGRHQASASDLPPLRARATQKLEARGKKEESTPASTTGIASPAHARAREGPPTPDPIELADHLCRMAGVRNLEPTRIAANADIVREWLKAGADPPLLAATVQTRRDRASNGIHALKYFDPAIRQAIARRDHPNGTDSSSIDDIRDPLLREYLARGGTLEDDPEP